MMDGSQLFPEGHHPIRNYMTSDISRPARCFSRLERPVKYYFIDFGMSTHFMEGDSPYVLGAKGGDQDPPELSNDIPYDAFMLDVYILGHLYDVEFLQVRSYIGWLLLKSELIDECRHTTAWIFSSPSFPL